MNLLSTFAVVDETDVLVCFTLVLVLINCSGRGSVVGHFFKWSLRVLVLLLSHLVHIGLPTDSLSMGRPAPW